MVLDIIGIIIIGYFLYSGVKKGFVKSIFSSLSFILALALTVMTLNPVVDYVKETEFGKTVYEKTELTFIEENADNESAEDGEEEMSFLSEIIDTDGIIEEATKIQGNISKSLGDIVIRSICALALFVIYIILIKIAASILDATAKLPVLKTFNKIGGILAGAVNAYIFMAIFCCIIMLLMSTSFKDTVAAQLEASLFTSWFYSNNPFF